jgi:hypothetical protein
MKLNKDWHAKHKMPRNPTLSQRIIWHVEHLKHCQCRSDYPEYLKNDLRLRGLI